MNDINCGDCEQRPSYVRISINSTLQLDTLNYAAAKVIRQLKLLA